MAPIEPLKITQHDLQPYYRFKFEDSTGTAISLTGATVVCTLKTLGGIVKINRQTAGINITDSAQGEGEYQWQTGDTDTAGTYHIEIEATPASGGKFTGPFPQQCRAEVHIEAGQDSV